MYPNDYNNDFKTISEEQIGSCIYAHLQAKKYACECECCGSSNIQSKGFRTKRDFRDITSSNETVYLTIDLRRYRCKSCAAKLKAAGKKSGQLEENGKTIQTTYTLDCLPDCVPEDGKISASIVDEIISIIAMQHKTVNEAAVEMNIAPSSASAALKKRRKTAEEAISTFQEPDCLLVYPYNYVKTERCALIGLQGDRPMLYGLLNDCTEKTIRDFLEGKDTKDDRPWNLYTVLTDFPRPDEHKMLDERYKHAELGILRECVLDRIAKLRKKSYGRNVLAIIDDALEEMDRILETHVYDPMSDEYVPLGQQKPWSSDEWCEEVDIEKNALNSFKSMFQSWWDALPESAQKRLSKFRVDITGQYEKVVIGFTHIKLEHNPSKLLRFIGVCRERKISFEDLPGWLALVAGVHNKENISAVQMMSSSFVPQPIHDFYIDLDELNDLMEKECG